MVSRSLIRLILGASLVFSLVAALLYAVTASSVLLYLAWSLLLPALLCFFLLARKVNSPQRAVRVHHRYYSPWEDDEAVFEGAYEEA